jgi:hypothetical protein
VKFNDADLIGIPIRVTVGKRSLDEGGVELKLRDEKDRSLVPLAEALERVEKRRRRSTTRSPTRLWTCRSPTNGWCKESDVRQDIRFSYG